MGAFAGDKRVDSFGGGFAVQTLIALWLFQRFGLSLGDASLLFFVTGLGAAFSQLAAPALARRELIVDWEQELPLSG